jgi:PAS domain S-box-containing protein
VTSAVLGQLVERYPQAMSHATVRADATGRITDWDAGAEQMFGHTAADAVGQLVELIVPEPLREAHWNGFHRAMRSPEIKDMAADLPVLCADGVIREFAGRLLALSDGLGVAIGAIAIYTDDGLTGFKPFGDLIQS